MSTFFNFFSRVPYHGEQNVYFVNEINFLYDAHPSYLVIVTFEIRI